MFWGFLGFLGCLGSLRNVHRIVSLATFVKTGQCIKRDSASRAVCYDAMSVRLALKRDADLICLHKHLELCRISRFEMAVREL